MIARTRKWALDRKQHVEHTLETEYCSPYRTKVLQASLQVALDFLCSHCDTCGRTLTDPESIRLGRGPECRKARAAS